MAFRLTNQARNQTLASPTLSQSSATDQEKHLFVSIADKLSDGELWRLLQDRGRWNPRASSLSSSSRSQPSAMSFYATPSLCRSSMSSNRVSMMSIDGGQTLCTPGATMEGTCIHPDTHVSTDEMDLPSYIQGDGGVNEAHQYNAAVTPVSTGTDAKEPRYYCTYCPGPNPPSFKRSSDWKSHETERHQVQRKYACAHSGDLSMPCRDVYLSKPHLQRHHEMVHKPQGCPNNCSGLRNVPITTFACGFRGCSTLFKDNPANECDAWSDRCKHIARHFKEGKTWDYSHMTLNLLHQPILNGMWNDLADRKAREQCLDQKPLYLWSETNTQAMRQMLETRFSQPFDAATALQILTTVYNAAILQFPGKRAIPNVGLLTSNEDAQSSENAIFLNATTPLLSTVDATTMGPQTTCSSGIASSGLPVDEESVLRSNRTPPNEDFTEGTLRPRGRFRARSDAANRPTSTRSHSRWIRRIVSRDRLVTGETDAKDPPPVPKVPSKHASTTPNKAAQTTEFTNAQAQYGGHAHYGWHDDQQFFDAQLDAHPFASPPSNGADTFNYYD